jgi:hypothetical protein
VATSQVAQPRSPAEVRRQAAHDPHRLDADRDDLPDDLLPICRSFAHTLPMTGLRTERLTQFSDWVARHITGDEKGEAQIFLDRLFIAFGHKGLKEAGATLEMRVKKDEGGTAFADLVWKPVVLIEMKKRGEDLTRHYRQAFDYWTRLVPGRPRYVVLCNFDEFWVYDFETQMDTPVDRVKVGELVSRYGPLAFLFVAPEKPVFGNHHEEVTRTTADLLAGCFNKLIARKVERPLAQRFILQVLVALFAEDIGLLPKYLVSHLLDECKEPTDSFDLLGGLFVEMNTRGTTPGGRFKGVDYFNGGLFAQPARLELYADELRQLKKAAEADWSKVRPEIFGTLFEHSVGESERHAYGAHFTHPTDIMKIVGPTIVEPWRERIESAKSLTALGKLRERMQHYTVLDPACGSGNFLYIAYRELKRLEARIFERMQELSTRENPAQKVLGFVTARQFYGLDVNPFAVELAKVTMMIARKLAIDELHVSEEALPLDNLDANFVARDALIDEHGNPAPWPKADVIIGNPPFLGAKRLKPERGVDYVNAVRKAYPDVPGMADYCVYWFRKAHDLLPECTADDPVTGRAGLVGTQNIRNNQSRVGGLDHIAASGTIVEAVENQPWSGEANVHVSIANWVKTQDAKLVPARRRLWSKFDATVGSKRIRERGSGPASKEFELVYRDSRHINSALSDQIDVSVARVLGCNAKPQRVFQGITPGHSRFVLDVTERDRLLSLDKDSRLVIYPYLGGDEVLEGDGRPERYVIDFQQRDMISAQAFKSAFNHVRSHVLPDRQAKVKKGMDSEGGIRPHHKQFLERWWRLSWDRADMVARFGALNGRFIACSRVTKRPILVFVSTKIRPGDALQVFTFDDDYGFGILQSDSHWQWFVAKCSKLKSDFRYTPDSVFDTFPWPQVATVKQIDAVAEASRKVRRVRAEALTKITGGLRAVYRTLELPGKNPLKDAHAELDAAVLAAYGFSAKKDLLAQILDLNLAVADRIAAGKPVVPPGVPSNYPDAKRLVTEDCIRP